MNNEKLKIDLCGRLPYGVVVRTQKRIATSQGKPMGYAVGELIGYSERKGYEIVFDKDDFSEYFDNVRPFLFPISSFTKTIQLADYNNGEPFVPKEELRRLYISEQIGLNPATWSHRSVVMLDKWKIDYRGLINEGLAIEVNSDNNPYL